MLPGNQRGLSGSAAAARTVTDRVLAGAVYVLRLSFLPPKKEAFVAPTIDPLFWELGEERPVAAIAEEAQTEEAICGQFFLAYNLRFLILV